MADFKLTVELLDKRICDVEEGASNTETYREFIHNSERYFDLPKTELDKVLDVDLNRYFNFLCGLWDK